ncbi:RNA-binding protein [Amylocarpus encephaloides]|uniref:RNA-binding protein n=1 Tax=Amylocarpus encephaloides TaxID=45428 RepID=A0A9P7Y9U7_9HELO|nr:RNA-binding protein [Amylocarpus encephaloides]
MARGEAKQTKIHYKGTDEDFIIFVEDAQIARDWKTDKTIPLTQVVSAFKIFVTHNQGVQGTLNDAPNSTLENEFGTHNEEDVIKQIIEKGNIQEVEGGERFGSRNDSMGSRAGH